MIRSIAKTTKTKLSNAGKNQLENPFAQYLTFMNIQYVRQFKPVKDRRYQCDFFLPQFNVIIEIEGGQWINGRHQRGIGFKNDMEKYNLLTMMNYRLIRLTTDHFLKINSKQYAVAGYSANIVKSIIDTWG